MTQRVLVIDDERGVGDQIRGLLAEDGVDCELAEDALHGLKLAEDLGVGAVLLGLTPSARGGIETLRALRERRPSLRVIVLGTSAAQELLLEALRRGAADYLAKPIHEEELRLAVRRALDATQTATRFESLRARLAGLADDLSAWQGASADVAPDDAADALIESAARLLGAARTSLLVADGEDRLRVAAIRGGDHAARELAVMSVRDSVAGLALDAEEGLLIDDVDRDERCAGRARRGRYGSGSALLVPLRGSQGPLGVLCATERPPAQPFAEEDLALARLLAFSAAPRLAPAPVAEAPAPEPVADPEEAVRVELAQGVAAALTAEIEPGPLLRAALRKIAEQLGAAPVSLYLVDSRAGSLALEAAAGDARTDRTGAPRTDRPRLPRDRGLAGRVLQGGGPIAADRPEDEPGFVADVDTPEDGVAGPLCIAPIAIRGRVLGLARAFLPAGSRASLRTAEVIGTALSAAVRNALLYRSLLESIDDLARARREANERKG
ncbi:MAG TPA: GAF domain-containing protein [Myxococcota bacterium]|nr:GAF domain-containing protein [Myxococcota bacterium]